MNWLRRLPGSQREPSGLEWAVLKRLPAIFLAGTLLPALVVILLQAGLFELSVKEVQQAQMFVTGLVFFHWMAALTVAIFCLIVVLMKGHAYVADAYPLPDSDQPQR